MMSMWVTTLISIAVLAAVAPYVARVRHPQQRPFAAYTIFVIIFAVTSLLLFIFIGWAADALGLVSTLGPIGLMLLLVIFGLGPAFALATWQVRKPPMRMGPPD
jgi:small basic protein